MLSLSHRRWEVALDAYVDRELPDHAREALVRHLDECEGCRGEVALLHAVKHSLTRIAERRPTPLATPRMRQFVSRLTHQTPDRDLG